MDRDGLDIESEGRPLDHSTLIATLKSLGIPVSEDQFNYTSIIGDVAMARQFVAWAQSPGADIEDVHLEILDVAPQGSVQWQDLLVPRLAVRCLISSRKSSSLRCPLCMEVEGLSEDGKPLSRLATSRGAALERRRGHVRGGHGRTVASYRLARADSGHSPRRRGSVSVDSGGIESAILTPEQNASADGPIEYNRK
jgi:hypothetical protein